MTPTLTSITSRPKSQQSYEQLCQLLPGGTNSPVRAFRHLNIPPVIATKGDGDTIYDVDNNAYIDYCCSWGPLILGHAHPTVIDAIQQRAALGTSFGISTPIEGELAKKITSHLPSIERIRFVSSGTEATMTAARIARGYTKRDLLVKFSGNYHGHADFFLVQAGSGVLGLTASSSSSGIPEEIVHHTACLPYNDIDACRQFLLDPANSARIAGVILEPIAGNIGCVPATKEFLQMLREVTKTIGAVLIFDEVITGFRVGLNGAQGLYGITPDLTCLGKVIGGGLPAAAVGGKKEIMEVLAPLGTVYQAGTLSGNPIAMEAGLQTIQLLEQPGVYQELEEKTNMITQPVKAFLERHQIDACLQQVGSMFTLFFGKKQVNNMDDACQLDKEAFSRFFCYMLEHGVYFPPAQQEAAFVSTAHTREHLETTRDLILDALKHIFQL